MTSPRGQRSRDSEPPVDPELPDELGGEEEEHLLPPDVEARSGFERLFPELLRRGFEAGRVPLERVSGSVFPRDIAANLVSQLGDLRSGVVKAVAQEVGRFLREADIASEVRKVLTGMDVEAHVKLRFKAREDGSLKPDLQIEFESPEPESDDKDRDKPRSGERRKR